MDVPPHENPGPDPGEAALRRLAERLLDYDDPFGSQAQKPRLFVGSLPEGLPVEVPVPGGLVLLGCVSRGGEMRGPVVEAVLDSVLAPDRVLAAYGRALRTEGWYEPEDRRRGPFGGGFVPAAEPKRAVFCKGERGPGLVVAALDAPEAEASESPIASEVRLALFTDPSDNPCVPDRFGPHGPPQPPPIPDLVPPSGARTLPGHMGGGGGPDDWSTSAALAVDLAPGDLEAHYGAQLGAAGWSHLEGGSGERHAWSVWGFEHRGRPWVADLSSTEFPGRPGSHLLRLHASAVPDATVHNTL